MNGELVGLKVAKAWGMSPYEWRQQSADDRALMTAYEMFGEMCEGYRMEWREQREANKKNVRGPNPYDALLNQMGIPSPRERRPRPE